MQCESDESSMQLRFLSPIFVLRHFVHNIKLIMICGNLDFIAISAFRLFVTFDLHFRRFLISKIVRYFRKTSEIVVISGSEFLKNVGDDMLLSGVLW